ncbi:helix-turn-helix domain-containing protein [Nitratireductor alexandrii]|uniref:helix-turn-helix domain-containing protein n=1 Tax=Nitratireductor alexandrii TaxID=2448161 RepID=UPI000FDCA104
MAAERWGCSERHVRNLINNGDLAAFKVGSKLVRIRSQAIEAFECQNGVSPDSAESIVSHGTMAPLDADTGSEQQAMMRRPAAPRLSTPNSRALVARR